MMRKLNVVLTAATAIALSAAPLSAQWGISDRNTNCRYVERVIAGRVVRQRVCDGRDRVYDRNGNVIYRRDGVYRRDGNGVYRRDDRDSDYRKDRKRWEKEREKERKQYEKERRKYEKERAKAAAKRDRRYDY
jgi:hypothetical protein